MWHKVDFAPHLIFLRFSNVFIGFVECSMGCGKMSTLRHTLKACKGKGLGDVKSVKKWDYRSVSSLKAIIQIN